MKNITTAIFFLFMMLGNGAQAQSWKGIVLKSADFAADKKCEIVSSALAQTDEGLIYSSFWHCNYETDQWGHDYRCFDFIATPNRDSKCEGVFKN